MYRKSKAEESGQRQGWRGGRGKRKPGVAQKGTFRGTTGDRNWARCIYRKIKL